MEEGEEADGSAPVLWPLDTVGSPSPGSGGALGSRLGAVNISVSRVNWGQEATHSLSSALAE